LARTFKPPATQRVYDVCVIGSRLAGVTAGALLARRGFRVLHVDHEAPAGSYEEGGYLLPAAPVLLPSPRFLPAAQAALTELGLTTDLARQLEPVVPDFQVILPRHRLDLPRDAAARAAELRREWPADAERLEGALSELQRLFDAATPFLKAFPPLPPTGLRERWALLRARRFAASAPGAPVALLGEPRAFRELGAHPLATALRAANRFLGHLDGEPSALGLTRILGAALRGTHRLPGGKDALCEMLRRKIAESRGELLGGDGGPAVAEAMELDGRRVAAVRLAGSKDAYVARAFVVATEAAALRALLPREGSARLATLLQAARPSHLLLTVNLVVKAGALPPGLGEAALVL
jgi:phytoene dehydrogenase-like protein